MRAVYFTRLYYPIMVGALSICLAIFGAPLAQSVLTKVNVLGFLSFEEPVSADLIRVLVASVGLALLAYVALRDYTPFFPKHLRFTIFFDNDGIERLLSTLCEADARLLEISPSWKEKKERYITQINLDLVNANVPFQFREDKDMTTGRGEMYFKVAMVGSWGAQEYRIVEAKGPVTYRTEAPGTQRVSLFTNCELIQNEAATISASVLDVYARRGIVICPTFKQSYIESPSEETYYTSVIAATRIDIFPYINISKTVYLVRDGHENFPIGYAFYSPH